MRRLRASLVLGLVGLCFAAPACGSSNEGGAITPSSASPDGGASPPAGDAGAMCTDAIDLGSDPAHCGVCNHSCFGGACRKGVCEAKQLANVPSEIENLAVGSDAVFVGQRTEGTVLRVPFTGGSATSVELPALDPGVVDPSTTVLGVDETHVYWVQDEWIESSIDGSKSRKRKVGRTPLAGGAFELLPSLGSDSGYVEVVYRSSFSMARGAIWYFASASDSGGTLQRYDVAKRAATTALTLNAQLSFANRDLDVEDDALFLLDQQNVTRVDLSTNATSQLVLGSAARPVQASRIAVDATSVYVTEDATNPAGAVARAPITGGPLEELFVQTPENQLHDIAVDAKELYVLDSRTGSAGYTRVSAVAKDGGSPVVLYTGPSDDYGIVNVPRTIRRAPGSLVFHGAHLVHRIATQDP